MGMTYLKTKHALKRVAHLLHLFSTGKGSKLLINFNFLQKGTPLQNLNLILQQMATQYYLVSFANISPISFSQAIKSILRRPSKLNKGNYFFERTTEIQVILNVLTETNILSRRCVSHIQLTMKSVWVHSGLLKMNKELSEQALRRKFLPQRKVTNTAILRLKLEG